ncbi:hypothetical protein PISMIDRAFT_673193 [Pisolithus microcarpus 441]|uniref:Unplaced genomic scaffold scaffold_7, whole genome shotgun sequence n=1 Tax=Pisolithus microcarpus 441 TaxID=765257 RepID=A0A0C9ZSC0_9AGAM|nr:hypothetical protein BKA83DRAFT_673193 [Pisolithus microcarpus]KIK28924.1 hypothetical protein PISMIDRAFT_673193 [Pisolithus microcarpus 441]
MNVLHKLIEKEPLLEWPIKYCLAVTATTYILSLLTGNVSQVDKVWTFLPAIYTAYYALLPLWPSSAPAYFFPYVPNEVNKSISGNFSPRALLMLALVLTWMCRLSYNTWRRGLYSSKEEDYRWAILRQKIPTWLFQIFNLTFIAIAQNILLFLLGIPTMMAVAEPHTHLGTPDYVLASLGFATLFAEFVADNQQYSFQTFKRSGVLEKNEWSGARIPWTKRDAERGFATRGLWAWSRHPNFFCEQLFWIIINLFPLLSSGIPSSASLGVVVRLAPCLLLCLLFFSSTKFTESISLSKYPVAYAAYQQRVGMFDPFQTPIRGVWLKLQGTKTAVDELVYGQDTGKVKKVE